MTLLRYEGCSTTQVLKINVRLGEFFFITHTKRHTDSKHLNCSVYVYMHYMDNSIKTPAGTITPTGTLMTFHSKYEDIYGVGPFFATIRAFTLLG